VSFALGLPAPIQEQAGWEGETIVFLTAPARLTGAEELRV
jgi:hypothetical protein